VFNKTAGKEDGIGLGLIAGSLGRGAEH